MTMIHRGRPAKAALVPAGAALALGLALGLAGCKSKTECKAEVMTGSGAYKGQAVGEAGDTSLRRKATKDACSTMCIETKSVSLDGCSARCVVDAEAGKVGTKITCSDDAAGSK